MDLLEAIRILDERLEYYFKILAYCLHNVMCVLLLCLLEPTGWLKVVLVISLGLSCLMIAATESPRKLT